MDNFRKITRQQKKALIWVIPGLFIVIFIIYAQQNRFFLGEGTPMTENQARRQGKDVERIKLEMSAPIDFSEINFNFSALVNNLPSNDLDVFKQILFEEFPYYSIYTTHDFNIDSLNSGYQADFMVKPNDQKEYNIAISHENSQLNISIRLKDLLVHSSTHTQP